MTERPPRPRPGPALAAASLLALAFGAPLAFGSPLAAQTLPVERPEAVGVSAERLDRVESTLQSFVEDGEVSGAVSMVVRDGAVIAFDSVGVGSVEAGRPIQGSALFRIASMTKPITSVAAMILVEEGRLQLSDPLEAYIPAFAEMEVARLDGEGGMRTEPARRSVTIRDLLTHRAGFTYGFLDDGPVGDAYREGGVADGLGDGPETMAENVERLARQPLVHHPGEAWQYGLSTDVLGRVVEVASGRTLAEFFRERIFEPLGMRDTHFAVPPDKVDRVAGIHQVEEGRLEPVEMPVVTETRFYSGGAGLYSTADDYARFMQMLLNGGTLEGRRILSPKTVDFMTRSHTGDLSVALGGPGVGFGLGFAVIEDPGRRTTPESAESYYWGGIYGTTFWIDPREDLAAVGMIQLSPNTADAFGGAVRHAVYQALTESRTFEAAGR